MFPVLFRIGNFELHAYGVLVACAVLIGIWVSIKEARRRQINIDRFLDILFWVIIGGIFGARIWHLVWYDPHLLVTKPWEIVMLWHGGMAIHGHDPPDKNQFLEIYRYHSTRYAAWTGDRPAWMHIRWLLLWTTDGLVVGYHFYKPGITRKSPRSSASSNATA